MEHTPRHPCPLPCINWRPTDQSVASLSSAQAAAHIASVLVRLPLLQVCVCILAVNRRDNGLSVSNVRYGWLKIVQAQLLLHASSCCLPYRRVTECTPTLVADCSKMRTSSQLFLSGQVQNCTPKVYNLSKTLYFLAASRSIFKRIRARPRTALNGVPGDPNNNHGDAATASLPSSRITESVIKLLRWSPRPGG